MARPPGTRTFPLAPNAIDRLLFDLRRDADRLRFGRGDADGAVPLWRDAAARSTSARLTTVARAEAALLEARLGRVEASTVLATLHASFDSAQREAARRPLTLLLAHAARMKDRDAACRLGEAWARGEVATVPLTEAERQGVKAF